MADLVTLNDPPSVTTLQKSIDTNRDLNASARMDTLPYRIEKLDEAGLHVIYFSCPHELVEILMARQVLARGSCFDILPTEVCCRFAQ